MSIGEDSSSKGLDRPDPLWYNAPMNSDPDSFSYRLRKTISTLQTETEAGVEDWTPTIVRLQEVLAEEEGVEEGHAYCGKHGEWYEVRYWSCCEKCWKAMGR